MSQITRRGLGLTAVAAASFGLRPLARPSYAQGTKEALSFAAVTFSEAGRGERLRALMEKFNKSQDRLEIQPVALPFATLANTVFTQMGGGGGPDIIRFDHIDFHAAVPAKRVLPLDDLMDFSGYNFTALDRFMKIEGRRFAVNCESSNYVMLHNKALVPEAPKTFEDFLRIAKEQTTEGRYGYAYRATMAERPGFWQDLCNFVYGHGGRWSDGKGMLTLDSPGVLAGVEAYKRVYEAGIIPRGTDAATYRRMFWEGKLAMEVDNGGVAAIFHQQAPQLQLGAAPSPFPERAQGVVLTPLTINANTKNKPGCVTFLKWFLQPDTQRELQQILGASNVATLVDRTPEELATQPWLKVYDDQTPNSIPQPVEGFETRTPEIQQIVLEQVLRVLQTGSTPKAAMESAQRMATARLRR
jgi:multiple sugar transport system substrate-binding protein